MPEMELGQRLDASERLPDLWMGVNNGTLSGWGKLKGCVRGVTNEEKTVTDGFENKFKYMEHACQNRSWQRIRHGEEDRAG